MAPTCLNACLTTLGHSPNDTANCVLRDLLADLDPLSSWTVFGETWLCQMYQNIVSQRCSVGFRSDEH